MSKIDHKLTRDDVMDMDAYALVRNDRRSAMTVMKKDRRVHIGPDATAYFESFDTMWHQIHEMLYIEKGGEAQIQDELNAYAPLVPNGQELVCTLMFEIDDEFRRGKFLSTLGGVEHTVCLRVDGTEIKAVAEDDIDRTTAAGKASSIQFLHFPFTEHLIEKFCDPKAETIFVIEHENYGHMAILSLQTKRALASDFT